MRRPASPPVGRPYNTDATALPAGDIQIPIVVADDMTFVEHPGNAERPHAAAHRPIPSLHRPSGWSRSLVLASLRALHLDQRLRSGARHQEGLDRRGHTGNALLDDVNATSSAFTRVIRPSVAGGIRIGRSVLAQVVPTGCLARRECPISPAHKSVFGAAQTARERPVCAGR
jgi:hypothetical protein